MFDPMNSDFWLCAMVAILGGTMGFTLVSLLGDVVETSWWPSAAATIVGLGLGLVLGSFFVPYTKAPAYYNPARQIEATPKPLHKQGFCFEKKLCEPK